MEWEKIVDKIRDVVLGEIKEEFKQFRASVTGELSGFRLAIESLNARQGSMENELRDIRKSIEYTNKRIDELRTELKAEIRQNTLRIDETNKRIDAFYLEISEIKGELKKALSDKVILEDLIFRIERLETKIAG